MPILKLTLIPIPICKNPRRKFDRIMRTLACTPSSSLSPSPPSSSQTLIGCIRRSTLAGGAGLGFYAAHVSPRRIKVSTFGSIFEKNNNREGEKKRILFSLSSFSSPFSSLSSSKEEEEREKSGGLVADMGHENSNDGVVLRPSGVVSSSKLLTLPTILTLGRVAAVPAFVATYYGNSWWATAATTSIFVAAAITDWLDGYLARKMRLGTAFGAFLDPVADKLMVAAALVLLCSKPPEIALFGDMPWLFPVPAIAIIGREITMSAVREWAASQNSKLLEAVAVNNLGKWKTATQMTALTILLAIRDSRLSGSETAVASGVTLLYISAGLAVWSLVVYMGKIWKVLLR